MIKGERVYLKSFDYQDVSIRTRWMNDPKVREFLNSPFPVSEASTTNWLNNLIKDETRLDFIVCLNDSDTKIGYAGFRNIDCLNKKAEFYMGIGEINYWGGGYGKEIYLLSLRYIFQKYDLNIVYGKVRSDHQVSIRIHTKIGFKIDGILRCDIFSKGKFHDTVVMSILKSEFDQKHGLFIQDPY